MHQSSWKMFQSEVWMHVTMCQWYTQLTPSQKFEKGTRVVQWPFSDLLCRYKATNMALPYLPQPQLNFPGPDLSPESNEGNVQVHDLATSATRMLPLCVLGKEDDEIVSSRVFSLFLNRFLWGGKGNFLVILKSCTNHKCALWKHVMKI